MFAPVPVTPDSNLQDALARFRFSLDDLIADKPVYVLASFKLMALHPE